MNISLILERKYSGAQWSLDGFDYDGLVWLSDTAKPTKKQIEDLWPEVQAEVQAEENAKIAKRQAAEAKLVALGLDIDDLKALGLA